MSKNITNQVKVILWHRLAWPSLRNHHQSIRSRPQTHPSTITTNTTTSSFLLNNQHRHRNQLPSSRHFSSSTPAKGWFWSSSASSPLAQSDAEKSLKTQPDTLSGTALDSLSTPPSSSTVASSDVVASSPNPSEFITTSPVLDASSITASTALEPPVVVLDAITAVGDFAKIGLADGWGPTALAQHFLELTHVLCGGPWWVSIMVATAVTRLCLLPIMIKVTRASVIMQNIKPLTEPITTKLNAYRAEKKVAHAQAESQKLFAIFKEHKVNPMSGLWSLVQMPVFFGFFFAVKSIAELPVPGMVDGGISWFTNLALPDPYGVLNIIAGLSMLAALEAGPKMGNEGAMQAKIMRNMFRAMSFGMMYFMSWMPAAVSLYSVVSNGFTLAQSLLLKTRTFRRVFGIPMANPVAAGMVTSVAKGNGFRAVVPASFSRSWKNLRSISKFSMSETPVAMAIKETPLRVMGATSSPAFKVSVADVRQKVPTHAPTMKRPGQLIKSNDKSAASSSG